MNDIYYVQVKDYLNDSIVAEYGGYRTERLAEKADKGININIDTDNYYTVIVTDKERKDER